ncbi:MAG TPA: hypothetical protein VFR80_08540, partial [Pyrinomonadaceae bacterium]|nr:hypothetical protein [Pyrinomonadaceae bacterium]
GNCLDAFVSPMCLRIETDMEIRCFPGAFSQLIKMAKMLGRITIVSRLISCRRLLTLSVIGIVLPVCSYAQTAAPGIDAVRARYTKYEYRVPMRDGVRLFTSVGGEPKYWQEIIDHTTYDEYWKSRLCGAS